MTFFFSFSQAFLVMLRGVVDGHVAIRDHQLLSPRVTHDVVE